MIVKRGVVNHFLFPDIDVAGNRLELHLNTTAVCGAVDVVTTPNFRHAIFRCFHAQIKIGVHFSIDCPEFHIGFGIGGQRNIDRAVYRRDGRWFFLTQGRVNDFDFSINRIGDNGPGHIVEINGCIVGLDLQVAIHVGNADVRSLPVHFLVEQRHFAGQFNRILDLFTGCFFNSQATILSRYGQPNTRIVDVRVVNWFYPLARSGGAS